MGDRMMWGWGLMSCGADGLDYYEIGAQGQTMMPLCLFSVTVFDKLVTLCGYINIVLK